MWTDITMTKKQLLTTNDMALVLEVTPGRARQLVCRVGGKDPEIHAKYFGMQRMIARADFERYILAKGIENPKWELIDIEYD